MTRLIVSLDGAVIKDMPVSKDRITLGRRPYNDIVIDHLAVSGEHAAFLREDDGLYVEDLQSTNGTRVNGRAITRQQLQPSDTVEIGKFRVRLADDVDLAMVDLAPACLRILTGPAQGREVALTKGSTTIGKAGESVATLVRGPSGHTLAHASGPLRFRVNGRELGSAPVPLQHGDLLELGTTQMQFVR